MRVFYLGIICFFGICSFAKADVYNYVDAGSSNTIAANGTSPWYSSTGSGVLWKYRAGSGLGNSDTVYEGWGDELLLVTTVSNLTPQKMYEIYIVFWDDTQSGTWGIQAGLSADSLLYYEKSTASKTGGTLSNLIEYRGFLGKTAADGFGKIKVYVDDGETINPNQLRTWYDGVEYVESIDMADVKLAISPKEDNWVVDGLPDLNPGASTSLRAGYELSDDRVYYSYVKFSLPEVPLLSNPSLDYQNISSAKLFLKNDSESSPEANLGIYYTPDDSWSESSITWNTKPNPQDYILVYRYGPTVPVGSDGWLYPIDLTEFVKSRCSAADFEWSLVLKDIDEPNHLSTYTNMFSLNAQRENRPNLVLEWDIPNSSNAESDFNNDGHTDFRDLELFTEKWLNCGYTDPSLCR